MGRQVTFDGLPQGEGDEATVFFGDLLTACSRGRQGHSIC